MMDRSRPYLAAADLLRAACVGLVGWYHIWQQSWLDPGFSIGSHYVNLQQLVRNGYMMVDVLLVLSGFLLALPYARARLGRGARPSPADFYRRRFWRIVPSYLLAILLTLFVWALPRGLYPSPAAMAKDLFAHVTFTHNLFADTYFATPLPGVLWTMGVEVQFYLLFPLIAVFYEDRPGLTCLLLALTALCFRLWLYGRANTLLWVNQLPCMLDLFACGMFAAWLYARLSDRELSPSARWALAAAALLALGVIFQLLYRQTLGGGDAVRRGQLLRRLPLGLAGGAFLLCGCLGPAALARTVGNPLTRFLSAVSYNFYIWHQFIAVRLKAGRIPPYAAAENPNMAGEQPWQSRYTALCFLAALAAGAAVTYLWERPICRRAVKERGREPAAPNM